MRVCRSDEKGMVKRMSLKAIIGGGIELVIKVAAFIFIVSFICKTAVKAYDYGYRVFAEEPMSVGEGRTISVYVEETASVKEIGEMLQEKGLIRDANLFLIQELLSENHGKLQPGIYDLNTSMTSEEMMGVMAAAAETEDLTGIDVPSVEEITGANDNAGTGEDSGDNSEEDPGEEGGEDTSGEGTGEEGGEDTSGEDNAEEGAE